MNIINRQAAEALIHDQVVSTIFQDAPKSSVLHAAWRAACPI